MIDEDELWIPKIDLTGKVFGYWNVICKDQEKRGYWKCKCKCGVEKSVSGKSLRNGSSKSCGCYQKELNSKLIGKYVDNLIGKRFGRLVVIGRDLSRGRGRGRVYWFCKCDCGNIKSISSDHLKYTMTKSCGCIREEIAMEKRRKTLSKYKYTPFDDKTTKVSFDENEFLIDTEDMEKVLDYIWYKDVNGYFYTSIYKDKKQPKISLHNLIMGQPENVYIDHANRNPADNRKCNLRICTHRENNFNKSLDKRNKTGVTGVQQVDDNTWVSQIHCDKKLYHLGTFHNFRDAVKARLIAEEKYFKEFSPQKNLFKEYGIKSDFIKEE